MKRKYTMTIAILKEWFNEFNTLYFDNTLPMWNFKIKTSTSYFGKCFYEKNLIIMSDYIDRDIRGFQQTFIHEMIHEWQYVNHLELNHGKVFQNKAKEINRKGGWQIQRCSVEFNLPVVDKKTIRKESDRVNIIMWTNDLGRRCFSKIPTNKTVMLYNLAKTIPSYKDIEVFSVPNKGYIKCFRKSNTMAYYYDRYAESLADIFDKKSKIAI